MKIAFVGWWTWGHIFPIKALVEYILKNKKLIDWDLQEDNLKIFRIWEKDSLEQKIAEDLEIEFYSILSWKIRRYLSLLSILKNFFDLFKLIVGFFQSLYFLYKNKIDIIFCKGGYVALPVVLAWAILRKKIYVHESDTIPWLTNKIAAKFAKKVFWGFTKEDNRRLKMITEDDGKEDINKFFELLENSYKALWWDTKVVSVWQILSDDLIKSISSDNLLNQSSDKSLYLSSDNLLTQSSDNSLLNILVIWWSQWAKTIFDTILSIAKKNLYKFEKKRRNIMIDERFKFFIILWTKNVGYKHNFVWFENVEVFEFVDQKKMWQLLYLADRSITRWWATSLAEQDIFWIKKIIIPLPFTAHNHQYWNALWYEIFRWDILLEQDENLEKDLENILFSKLEKKEKIDLSLTKEKIKWPKKIILDYFNLK